MTDDTLATDLESEFADATDADTAAQAAANLAALSEDFEYDLTAEEVTARVGDAPYDEFERRVNYVVGDIADEIDDCTDSRDYRFAGYGDVGSRGTWTEP